MLSEEAQEKYYEAGKVLSAALNKGREKVKAGMKLLEITKYIEGDLIHDRGYSPAFPLNIGIGEITAHYSCPIGDTTTIPEECLVKLDMGVQIDGYTTDMAVSVQVGTEKYQPLIDAAEAGLDTAIKMIKAGITVGEVAIKVEQSIRSYGVQPISNLSGHLMLQYQLHGGVSVPSVRARDPNNDYHFKVGDVFALEPFATLKSATGYVKNGSNEYIHALLKRKVKNLPPQATRFINRIWGERRQLPFSLRWYENLPDPLFNRLRSQQVIHGYPVLIEASNNPVAQAEKTIIVLQDGCQVL